jgi:hypothetical protein
MEFQTIDEMAKRLAALERSLDLARTEIRSLRDSTRRTTRARGLVICLTVVLAVVSRGSWGIAAGAGQTVTAPFTVVSPAGKKILQVRADPDGNMLTFADQNEKPVAGFFHSPAGGVVQVVSPNSKATAAIGIENTGEGIVAAYDKSGKRIGDITAGSKGGRGLGLYDAAGNEKLLVMVKSDSSPEVLLKNDNSHPSILLNATASGNYVDVFDSASAQPLAALGDATHQETSEKGAPPKTVHIKGLAVYGDKGTPVAAIRQNAAGKGTVAAYDSNDPKLMSLLGVGASGPAVTLRSGEMDLVTLALINGQPNMTMKNAKGVPIVGLLQSPITGGAIFQLGDPAGNAMVEAGVLESGRGLVRTFPTGTPAGLVGMPGTFIMGKKPR